MIQSKTIDLLRSFSENEFKEFGAFIRSPYFNKESAQVRFYEILKKYFPEFDGKGFDKKKVFKKLYPGKEYNDAVIRNLLSRMLSLAQEFIVVSRYQKNEAGCNLTLLTELNERRQEKLFERNLDITEKRDVIKDGEYFYKRFLLLNEMENFHDKKKSSLMHDKDIQSQLAENLSLSFMINMLKMHTKIANTNRYMLHYEQYKFLTKGIEEQIESSYEIYQSNTQLIYYYHSYLLAHTEDEKHYRILFRIIEERREELTTNEINSLFTLLANYCYTQINKGELRYLKEQFDLYKQRIEKKLYKGDVGFVSHIFFINIVVTGLENNEAEWVEAFMESHRTEMDELNRDNTYIFCKAFLCYWKKEYSEAFELAARIKTDDLSYKHQLKSLYLKIYFEMNETETFYSHIDSYRHFISKDNNVSPHARITINNYINYSKKLFALKNEVAVDKMELGFLKKEVIENKAMINKPWILRKIEEVGGISISK